MKISPETTRAFLAVLTGLAFLASGPKHRARQPLLFSLLGAFCLWAAFLFSRGILGETVICQTGLALVLFAGSYLLFDFLSQASRKIYSALAFRLRRSPNLPPYLNEIFRAAPQLAAKKIGALIIIERKNPLTNYIATGLELDSEIKAELLLSLFAHASPVHDGAVIVSHGRIKAVKTVLPLSKQTDLPIRIGTRHRAAIGITEYSDAIALVVSEERGETSVAYRGLLTKAVTPEDLSQLMVTALRGKSLMGLKFRRRSK